MKEESNIPFLRSTSVMKNSYTEMRYQRAYSGAENNIYGWPEENSNKTQNSKNVVATNEDYKRELERLEEIEYDRDRKLVISPKY